MAIEPEIPPLKADDADRFHQEEDDDVLDKNDDIPQPNDSECLEILDYFTMAMEDPLKPRFVYCDSFKSEGNSWKVTCNKKSETHKKALIEG